MRSNKEIQILFEKYLSGEISQSESDQLEKYAEEYPEYKQLMQLHKQLERVEFPGSNPDLSLFTKMRADVLREIRLKNHNVPGIFEEFIDKIKSYAFKPEMAVAALTLIIGFLFGRALPPDEDNLTSNLISQISAIASENTKLEEIRKSPVVYSNVKYRDLENDRVAINLDATTHLEFVREKDDPLVLEVMAQTLLSSSDVGTELKAISYTEGITDPRMKETLIYTMHNTPSLATRMKAMSNLSDYKNDEQIKEAFLRVLRKEESVKMRLVAIDYLTEERIAPAVLEQALDESEVTQSPAVLIRMRKYLESN